MTSLVQSKTIKTLCTNCLLIKSLRKLRFTDNYSLTLRIFSIKKKQQRINVNYLSQIMKRRSFIILKLRKSLKNCYSIKIKSKINFTAF